ncbi:TonB-dependent siderophore receptor [Vibrio fluvialis]|uniref:TonB-dependent receptor n=1 Tax=Vibrio sp. bablab_jr001 TaxID=2755067 RepID=UPI0018F1B9B3|nr:TonB-dependent siderophore receptor [Vibrio sp. bablab_jr001]EKO3401265.1 TonB-dependent siderophore receptor [Vibrio fluvialis]EKO3475464.1 TonB-dependent siderophore receptor [Vibrio fluvialis]ELM6622459.1 TonB-dependent siderophore receptor [Vibrio fluvialis]ELO1774947.1 TonB-dependent siderophore receptor [Vibrio fluvialis]MBY8091443.1 TonB-dependent siderophore receptor [Vibrio fluvialis]
MKSFRLSPVGLGVVAALALGQTGYVGAEETATQSSEAKEVITIVGSQVDLGGDYQGGQVARSGRAGILGNQDFMDTPFSSSNYTSKLIEDQQAKSVGDVLKNDPTVRQAVGYGNFQELYMIRGFPVYSDDMTLNGVYGILPRQYVAAEMLERVEVFRGANSFVNGAAPGGSAIGGSINLVPKRAGSEPLTRVTLGTQSGGQAYGAMDVARRFGDNQENGVRVNVVARNGDDAVDDQETQLGVLSLGFDHQGENFRMSADLGYQDHHIDAPRPSVTPGSAIPSLPSSEANYAQDWTYTDEKQLFGVVRGEYDFSSQTTGWIAGGMRRGKEHNLLANPTADADGNLTAYLFENVREDTVMSGDTGVRHEFSTGSVGHTVVVSGSVYQSRSKNAYVMSSSTDVGSLYDYDSLDQFAGLYYGGSLSDPKETERVTYSSAALADTLSLFDDQVKVMLGARLQRLETRSFDYSTGEKTGDYSKTALTPSVGVVYQPTLDISLYANYSEALLPGETAPADSSNPTGEVLKPNRSEQYEVGAKYDNGSYGAVVSLFQISKPSYMYDSNNYYTDNGEQRNRGIELSAFGEPIESVKVLGGVTLIDAEIVKNADATTEGKQAIGVPKVQANVNIEWATPFVEGLTLEGRTLYTGSQYASADNSLELPSWTRFDLGARYGMKLGDNALTLRARVDNVTDKSYWASAGGYPGSNYLVQGAPRTFVLSASYDF